jgi:O-antigen/teichoic acid export membrane protein
MPLMIVNAVVPPLIAETYVKGKKAELQRALRVATTLASIPAIILVIVFILGGERALGLIYGNFYSKGDTTLIILSLGQLANVCAGSCGVCLMMTGHHRKMMNITLITGLCSTVGSIYAAKNVGANGVAAVTALGLTLQNALMILYTKKLVGIWTLPNFSLRISSANFKE